ncbi:hypothetical protein GOP47_0004502 [Adiantum capillus-veneris]|uniref:Uncharacterized protein n=1 Tax=Adiantum capillus-veneris TaxID=13818 RepID=A0A9D4V877_ADICA|nr:hypothetical protein GOP47_0004502 [Adiantum capillus-veneris]
MVRKRERENPCYVCGHYHKFEDGEVCGVCGHRLQDAGEKGPLDTPSAFATEILPSFLYLGSYDNASRAELLKAQGITRILNTVPTCQNLYKNSFTYKTIKEDQTLPFDDCSEFIEQSRTENARVLVHCMSGQNRSPAVVIAYLMRYKKWRLAESYQWVKNRRPSINLSSAVGEQLQLYEANVFGPTISHTPMVPSESGLGFNFGFPATTPGTTAVFSTSSSPSSSSSFLSFSQGNGSADQSSFVFRAARQEVGAGNVNSMDSAMDSS